MKVHPLTVGPIVGLTTPDIVRLWGRGDETDDDLFVFGVVQLEDGLTQIFKMLPWFDYTGICEFAGLSVDEVYRYRMGYVVADEPPEHVDEVLAKLDWSELEDEWYSFKTAPDENTDISFSFGSCRYASRFHTSGVRGDRVFRSILENAAESPIDLLLMVGDQVYVDDVWQLEPEMRTEEFFAKYRLAFSHEYIQQLMASVSTFMILGDHEIRHGFNSEQLADRAFLETYMAARDAYLSYQAVHGPAYLPEEDPDADNKIRELWYDFDFGRASFFVMDSRCERRLHTDPAEIISEDQLEALLLWLADTRGKVRFVVTSVPLFPDHEQMDDEKWAGFQEQRLRILDHIRRHNISPVVFLSGDVHASGWASLTTNTQDGFCVHQIISSPFYWPGAPGESKRFRNRGKLGRMRGVNYQVAESEFITDEDNFVRIDLRGNELHVNCYGRKGKHLGEQVLELPPLDN